MAFQSPPTEVQPLHKEEECRLDSALIDREDAIGLVWFTSSEISTLIAVYYCRYAEVEVLISDRKVPPTSRELYIPLVWGIELIILVSLRKLLI